MKMKKSFFIIILFIIKLNFLFGLSDTELLDLIQQKCFNFFWNEVNTNNGLIKDRANNFSSDSYTCASIASVGFGLTAICIGENRGWVSYDDAYKRVLTTLNFFKSSAAGTNGFYYHFLDINTGARYGDCEVSSIDTALFLAGALFAGQYFKGTEIETLADELYKKADWTWMCNGTDFICMGWKDGGFLSIYWDTYNEGVLLDVLAIGSPTHPPINSPFCWKGMTRPTGQYAEYNLIYCSWHNSLFIHQYPQLYIDLRNKVCDFIDYYENSISATYANKIYCNNIFGYNENCWGVTACDGPTGYYAYGAPPWDSAALNDGTIAPTAAGGSVMFTPEISVKALRYFYENYYNKLWGKYGFADSFNPKMDWYATDVLGIDLGAILLSIENYRTGMVWNTFMKISYITNALNKMGFVNKPSEELSKLFQNYPNPFNLQKDEFTIIGYNLLREFSVIIQIYTVSGRLVFEKNEGLQTSGLHSIKWDGRDMNGKLVPPGIYVVMLKTNNKIKDSKKLIIIRK